MAAPPFRVKALYEYSSTEEDDLNFLSGQIITVIDVEDDDWYFGEFADAAGTKHEGLFPKNFVQIFEPETPPRPSRANRSKKEAQLLASSHDGGEGLDIEDVEPTAPPSVPESAQPQQKHIKEQREEPLQQAMLPHSEPESAAAIPPAKIPAKLIPPATAKPADAQAGEKGGPASFRDRINAFNKPAAAPVAPTKPVGLGSSSGPGFVKKPFVAPPPSKNAYVHPPREPPPQRVYRREEEHNSLTESSKEVKEEGQLSRPEDAPSAQEEEDHPKPQSLKDRIALLQKQQMEQAARRTDAAHKKDKPKPPAKKVVESEDQARDPMHEAEGEPLERRRSSDITGQGSTEMTRDVHPSISRSDTQPNRSRETTPIGSPVVASSRDYLSDPNDADQSGIGDTEESEDLSGDRNDIDGRPQRGLRRSSQGPLRDTEVGDREDNAEIEAEAEEEEEDDVDPEVKRRMEIRERMAKMSGGMGMAGMFGPPGGMHPRSSTKRVSESSDRKASGNSASGPSDNPTTRAHPIPAMPMPGLQQVRSPEQSDSSLEVSKEKSDMQKSVVRGQEPEQVPDVEDIKEERFAPSRVPTERAAPPPVPQARPVPTPAAQNRGPPPPLPAERPDPNTTIGAQPVPPAHPSQPTSPSEGSESDDEMSLRQSSLNPASDTNSRPNSQRGPPPLHIGVSQSSLPNRPAPFQSSYLDSGRQSEIHSEGMSPTSPVAPTAQGARTNRVPPIPESSPTMQSVPQTRAPPPPPPGSVSLPRSPTAEGRMPPIPPTAPVVTKAKDREESDYEITEYEGDYDTDMASSAPRKDALKSYAKVPSLKDTSMQGDNSFHHPGASSITSDAPSVPRAVPPPPPNQPPRIGRRSSDMPRAAPPPPPPPPPPKEQTDDERHEDYDPYNYFKAQQPAPPTRGQSDLEHSLAPRIEDHDPTMSSSPPQRTVPTMQNLAQYPASPSIAVPSGHGSGTRQSIDVQRSSTTIRRSTDGSRPSGEQGFIASDVDLGQNNQWWTRPDTPPPVFQDRRDVVFEIEETSTTRRGGKKAITKIVYVLFMDYSQTVVTAHFEAREPANASLEQRHEPPPQSMRQDQLELAHTRFGSRIAEGATPKEGSVIGDGSSNALVLDLLSPLPDALLPVGVRSYGALIYANLANASIRQFDEIRPGDVVTFRNAKFQGHRGAMHSKYSIEVGKPDHVGVVIDWDGTKKKVRAWEQGRESKKIKAESFKLGDMRSGEVRVWRVMARSWVGWEGQN